MSDAAIRVEGLSKLYRIGRRERYRALRDTLTDVLYAPFRVLRSTLNGCPPSVNGHEDTIWALKDVSFEIKQGEVVGVIGRNGAGKSTLLKILSRITEPTEGYAEIRGRVGSLLEVGTGFHPELTGRENIYLNGAILGMKKAEIERKFDEIVAFAEVEKFIDTPVKHYSSGMYVRLAFAVAAHLEPEILLVDEVLAVGDAAFQKKCLGKMGDVAKEGRTVLFVSHNMAAMSGLCSAAMWLADGTVRARGTTAELTQKYLAAASSVTPVAGRTKRHIGEDVRLDRVVLLVEGVPSLHVQAGQSSIIRVHYRILGERQIDALSLSIMLFSNGQKLANLWTNCHADFANKAKPLPRVGFADCQIMKWPFRSHSIRVDVLSHTGHTTQDWIEEALVFDSYDGDYYSSGLITNPDQGILFLDHTWGFHAGK